MTVFNVQEMSLCQTSSQTGAPGDTTTVTVLFCPSEDACAKLDALNFSHVFLALALSKFWNIFFPPLYKEFEMGFLYFVRLRRLILEVFR